MTGRLKTARQHRESKNKANRKWTEKKRKDGVTPFQFYISAEARDVLDRLNDKTKKPRSQIINEAILAIEHGKGQGLDNKEEIRPPETSQLAPVSIKSYDARKKELLERIKKLTESGMSQYHIAKLFNEEGVSTMSGRGKWWQSTIRNILIEIGLVQEL